MSVPIHEPTLADELQQEPQEYAQPCVPVAVEGPVRTQRLPTVVGSCRRQVLPADNTTQNIANQDYRRSTLIILATDQPFVFGNVRDQVDSSFAPQWPINVPLVITSSDAWYAKSATGSTAATLSIVEEDWSN